MTAPAKTTAATPDAHLLDVLVCPLTLRALIYDKKKQELVSPAARLAYPIKNGLPVLLPEEARKLKEEEIYG